MSAEAAPLVGVGSDARLIYLTLWSQDLKLVKAMGPSEATYLANRLLRLAAPMLPPDNPKTQGV